jgi:hypothetical protein
LSPGVYTYQPNGVPFSAFVCITSLIAEWRRPRNARNLAAAASCEYENPTSPYEVSALGTNRLTDPPIPDSEVLHVNTSIRGTRNRGGHCPKSLRLFPDTVRPIALLRSPPRQATIVHGQCCFRGSENASGLHAKPSQPLSRSRSGIGLPFNFQAGRTDSRQRRRPPDPGTDCIKTAGAPRLPRPGSRQILDRLAATPKVVEHSSTTGRISKGLDFCREFNLATAQVVLLFQKAAPQYPLHSSQERFATVPIKAAFANYELSF